MFRSRFLGNRWALWGSYNDSSYDRFILSQSVANPRARKLSCFTKLLAPGWLLAQASLPSEDHALRVCCDGLGKMYYTCVVPTLRARRNCLGLAVHPRELSGFSVFDAQIHNEPCYLLLLSTECFGNGRLRCGGICTTITFQCVGKLRQQYGRPNSWHIDARSLARHVSYFFRPHASTGNFGAMLHCAIHLCSSALTLLTLLWDLCPIRANGKGMSRRGSSWALIWMHILLFRRPACAVLSQVFADARRTPANKVFPLRRDSVNELMCLCSIVPLLQADLRAGYPGLLFCMDASPTGAGLWLR